MSTPPISRLVRRTLLAVAVTATVTSVAGAGTRPTILLTGYWPPTNEMVRPFSTNPDLNPDGWIGENWEGRGYDVHAFFPEFDPPDCQSCGQGFGDLEVDYQDTSADFWPIADGLAPIAVITFSRGAGDMSWELEMNQFNRDQWVNDYTAPLMPTPNPPDASVPVGFLRPSQLPVGAIVDAIGDAGLGLDPFICFTGDGGGFLSEFIAYHGVWYQSLHDDPKDPAFCATAGHIHVGGQVPWATGQAATEVTLRTLIEFLEQIEIDFYFPNGQPMFISPFGGDRIRAEVIGRTKDPAPGTGMLHYSTDGVDFTTVPMEEIEPNVYDAVFPTFECGERIFYYFSAESAGGEVVTNPFGAPSATYGADAYTDELNTFSDDFEDDLGWTVVNGGGLTAGPWERGIPAGGAFAPATDGDGSGQCFVTGLAKGEDVDGSDSMLISPAMDATDPNSTLVFEQWFASASSGGILQIQASDDDGASWRNFQTLLGPSPFQAWQRREFLVSDLPFIDNTDQFRVRFRIRDTAGEANTVEGGVDGVKIVTGLDCINPCVEDLDGNGSVGFGDVLALLTAWGPCKGCPEDLDEDGDVGFSDLLMVLGAWGDC